MATKRVGSMEEGEKKLGEPVDEPVNLDEIVDEVPEAPEPPLVEDDEDEIDDDVISLESMDPEEELWPGGPKVGQILEWKAEFGEVWVTTLNPYTNRHVLWRPLNRHEYRQLVGQLEQAVANGASNAIATMDNEEAITELVTLFPPYNRHDRRGTLAGMPQTISQEVLEMSGFTAVDVRQL